MIKTKLPPLDSIQALAHFWDTHDLTDFEPELEEVSEAVFERETTLTLRLLESDANIVREMARAKGIDTHELIEEWVREKIRAA